MRYLFFALCLMATPALADDPVLPNPALTPGDVLPVTAEQVCVPGYARSVRHVSGRTKHQVYLEYGMERAGVHAEVDQLIPLELGGSNDVKNLWPESFDTQLWNASVKDQLENRLHEMVCDGSIALEDAQHEIAGNWIDSYGRRIGPLTP